jgi:hypothetical protein
MFAPRERAYEDTEETTDVFRGRRLHEISLARRQQTAATLESVLWVAPRHGAVCCVTPSQLRELVELLHDDDVWVNVYPTESMVDGVDITEESLWSGEPSDCPAALFA